MSYGNEIRREFAVRLKAANRKNGRLEAVLIILTQVGAVFIPAWASVVAFDANIYLGCLAYVAAVLFIGTRYRALSNIIHECTHFAFTSDRNWNNHIGRLLSIPMFYSFDAYREVHLSHHRHTGDYEKDLDFKGLKRFRFHEEIDRPTIIRHFLTSITLQHVPEYIGRTVFKRGEGLFFNALRILYVSTFVFLPLTLGFQSYATWVLIGYIVVPYATALQMISYWGDALDHGGLFHHDDELLQTRNSIVKNPILRALLFPRNDCFHLVHHLFPHIPACELPRCHAELMKFDKYASLDHDLGGRTWQLWLAREEDIRFNDAASDGKRMSDANE
ncbi:fatty acid desaturase [Ensifer sp. ENS02]|uniref:fatty acid desaturase family protein n=1 Tax=Ensifer sp. ENS02 TaxID=2769290 RepID=UPI00177BB3AD|nr:fatty acid desaturase [Ensifer sp. ENS02]MBD9524228.1 fatty acid desaturase [Ensifer sp. ENS02]